MSNQCKHNYVHDINEWYECDKCHVLIDVYDLVEYHKAENERLESWEYVEEIMVYHENIMPTQDENFTDGDAARCWLNGDDWRKVNDK